MLKQIRPALTLLLVMTVFTGLVYPLVVTAIAQTVFHRQANGNLIVAGNRRVGSELVGQQFTRPEYFWGRLSATAPNPYNAAASSGSNFGPMHPGLIEAVKARIQQLNQFDANDKPVPVDLVTASASGLDPHISIAAAEFQATRIAKYRRMEESSVRAVIMKNTEPRQFQILGEPRVNVLMLNMELDKLQSRNSSTDQASL